MGKWKVINWIFYLVMLFFMYAIVITRYGVSSKVVIIISIGWLMFLGMMYYIFEHKLNSIVKKQ